MGGTHVGEGIPATTYRQVEQRGELTVQVPVDARQVSEACALGAPRRHTLWWGVRRLARPFGSKWAKKTCER